MCVVLLKGAKLSLFEEFCCEVKNLIAEFHVENQKPLFIFNFVLRVFHLTFWALCACNRVAASIFMRSCMWIRLYVTVCRLHLLHNRLCIAITRREQQSFRHFNFASGNSAVVFVGFCLSYHRNATKKNRALCMWFYSCQATAFQSKQLNIPIRNSLRFIWELRWKPTIVKDQKPISLS